MPRVFPSPYNAISTVRFGNNFADELDRPTSLMNSLVVSMTLESMIDVVTHGTSPSQYSDCERRGVPPVAVSNNSPSGATRHSGPSRNSGNRSRGTVSPGRGKSCCISPCLCCRRVLSFPALRRDQAVQRAEAVGDLLLLGERREWDPNLRHHSVHQFRISDVGNMLSRNIVDQ